MNTLHVIQVLFQHVTSVEWPLASGPTLKVYKTYIFSMAVKAISPNILYVGESV